MLSLLNTCISTQIGQVAKNVNEQLVDNDMRSALLSSATS
jgi:hypothetical protein